MIVIPAIDIRAGHCVRLIQGDYSRETVYEHDPSSVARRFLDAGARRIHVVDLDAARGRGEPASMQASVAVVALVNRAGGEVQIGGGVRDAKAARRWLDLGAGFVVLGSLALRDPARAATICEALPGRCLLSLDVRDGVAQAQGWTEPAGAAAAHLARWQAWPVAGVIRTNIAHDGMLLGPDLDGLRSTITAFRHPVFASGGVSTVEDVADCAEAGAAGVVVGRAIFQGRFDLRAALERFPQTTASR